MLEDQRPPAITRKMLQREILKDPALQWVTEDISRGVLAGLAPVQRGL